jgi:putative salt-induced outer membrane protein YdiY
MRATVLLLFSQLLWSAGVETVLLDNGDRLSGEVLKIEDGKLSLKTEYAGVVSIKWSRVQDLSSAREFQVEAETGLRMRGTMLRSGSTMELHTGDGPVLVEPAHMVRATPVEPESDSGFWQALEGGVDLGYNFARGNTDVNQSSVSVNTRYRTDNYKLQVDLASLLANQEGTTGANRHSGNLRFDRFLSPDAFVYTNLGVERDQRRALNLRTNFGGGLGWKVLKAAERELSVLGGVNYVNEQFRFESGTTAPPSASGEGQFGLDWRTVSPSGLQFNTRFALAPNVVQLGRYRIALETGARVPLVGRYVWSLNVFNRYDSKPPVEAQRTDYGAVSSLGITF